MATSPGIRRLSAIMFTDMVGYSARAQQNEALTLELLEEHRALLRPVFARHGGREIKTIGDAFLAEFPSALSAVECAVEIQTALAARNAAVPPARSFEVRIGIHLGDVVHREADVLGDGVNIASRVEPLAEPGGICITDIVFRQVEGRTHARIEPLGRVALKNIAAPMALYRVCATPPRTSLTAARLRAQARDARLGRRVAAASVAALLVAGVVGWLAVRAGVDSNDDGPGARLTVAVADFHNETRDAELDSLSGMLATSLQQSKRLTVLSRSALYDVLRRMGKEREPRIDEALGRELSREAGVDALVVVTVRKFDQLYSLDLTIVDPRKGTLLGAAKRQADSKARIPDALDELSADVRRSLNERGEEIAAARQSVTQSTTDNLQAYRHYFDGERLLGQMRLDKAEAEFERAVTIDPKFALAWYRLAYIRTWWHQDPSRSLARALELVDRVPPKERYLIRGLEAIALKREEEALRLYQQALREFPGDKELLYQLGDVAFHRGDLVTAVDYLSRVVAIDPAFDRAWHHLVWAASNQGDLDRALRTAEQYVRQAPGELAFLALAGVLLERGDAGRSLEVLNRAAELYPEASAPRMATAYVHIVHDRFDEAAVQYAALERSERLSNRLDGMRGLAWIEGFRGQYRAATRRWEQIASLAAANGDDRLLARSYASRAFIIAFGRRSPEGVAPLLAKAMSLHGQDPSVVFVAVESYLWAGMKDELAALAPYASGIPQGALIERIGGDETTLRVDAITGLEESARRAMTPSLVGMHLLDAYLAQNQPRKAIALAAEMEKFRLENFPEPEGWRSAYYPYALYARAKAHEMLGERAEAQKYARKLHDVWSEADPDLWLSREARQLFAMQ